MPRIKRWSPISHDFNRDPEIIEMRQRFGDWTALAWQEILHEADRNDGVVRGTVDQIAFRLAPISLRKYSKTAQKLAQNLLEFAQKHNWIEVKSHHIEVLKFWKYRKTWERKNCTSSDSPIPTPNPIPIPLKDAARVPDDLKTNPAIAAVLEDIGAKVESKTFGAVLVWARQSKGMPARFVLGALETYSKHYQTVENARSYLIGAYNRIEGKQNGLEREAEHESEKQAEADFAKSVYGGRGLRTKAGP